MTDIGDTITIMLHAKITGIDDQSGWYFVQPIGHSYRFLVNPGNGAIVQPRLCQHCSEPLRLGTPNSKKRFCNSSCRNAWHRQQKR